MKNKMMKRMLAGVLVLAVAVVGFVNMPKRAEAENAGVVKSQKVENADFVAYIDAKKAPECTLADSENIGYLFAGWYKDEALTEPIAAKDGISGDVYAKFVPSYLTGISCQIDTGEGEIKNLRMVSLVHSEHYSAVGFNVYGRYDADSNGTNETEWLMYSHDSKPAESHTLFRGLYAEDEKTGEQIKKKPEDVFGADAEGFYFTTVSITGIGKKTNSTTKVTVDFRDATMAVKPYWITLDGTYVEGMGEFNRVNDYYNKIVNVSVNLKNATDIAAGLVNITCPEGFTLVEGEVGRVFEQMACAQKDRVVRCVGNVQGMENSENPNDVYMNLRFSVAEGTKIKLGSNDFSVSIPDKGFCNMNEEVKTDVDAWDIKY